MGCVRWGVGDVDGEVKGLLSYSYRSVGGCSVDGDVLFAATHRAEGHETT
jgi:hypothetical protein